MRHSSIDRASDPHPGATASRGCLDGVFFRDAGDGGRANGHAIGESQRVPDSGAFVSLVADGTAIDRAISVAFRRDGSCGYDSRGRDSCGYDSRGRNTESHSRP